MLVLDNSDAIRGIAEVASQLDFIVNGYVGTTATQLADGQIGSSEGDLYLSGADATVVTSITVVNTDSSARTFTLYLKPSGGTSRAISPVSLDLSVGYSFYTDGQRIAVMDATGTLQTGGGAAGAHDLGGASHNADTLSNLNSKVSDATLVDTASIVLIADLENPPTEDEASKAPTSEWAFDHDAASTGIHGVGTGAITTVSTTNRSITVNGEGGADFTTVQAAVNDLEDVVSHAHTITVQNGTKKTGTADEDKTNSLVDDGNDQFVSGDVGKRVFNVTDGTSGVVGTFVDSGEVTIVDTAGAALDLFPDGNEDYVIEATPYRETVYLNSLPATNPTKLILGSVTIQAEYYWNGDCDTQGNAGEILDATMGGTGFANVEVGDRVWVLDLDGADGRANDYELGTVDDISQAGSNIIRTNLTKTPTANWRYGIVKTEISGSDDGLESGTARARMWSGSGIDNITINGFYHTFSDDNFLYALNCRNWVFYYNCAEDCDRGIRLSSLSSGSAFYNYIEGEYTVWIELGSSLSTAYNVLFALPTTDRTFYVVRSSYGKCQYSYLANSTGGADGEGIYAHYGSVIEGTRVFIENSFLIGAFCNGNSYIRLSNTTNNGQTAEDPIGTTEGAFIHISA